jgi:hypothetical protein
MILFPGHMLTSFPVWGVPKKKGNYATGDGDATHFGTAYEAIAGHKLFPDFRPIPYRTWRN